MIEELKPKKVIIIPGLDDLKDMNATDLTIVKLKLEEIEEYIKRLIRNKI